MGKSIRVRSIPYPLWNEGLFHRQPSHLLLFLIRIACIVIPVYLETRFISHSNPIPVKKLIRNAYVSQPNYHDVHPLWSEQRDPRNVVLLPEEVFHRCAARDDDGWVIAKIANVTLVGKDRDLIHCVKGTEQAVYRTVEKTPHFVESSVVVNDQSKEKTFVYQPNLTLEVWRDEGPFKRFSPWPSVEDDDPNRQYLQVKNVTVLDTKDFQCFFWRAPVAEGHAFDREDRIYEYVLDSFVCQNVTGNFVDFYFTSVQDLANESNTRILEQGGNLVSKQSIVSTTFEFIGSLEYKNEIIINAGHLSRHQFRFPPTTRFQFLLMIRAILYSRASNVTVEVPGDEKTRSVELDVVVIVVGAMEVIVVLVLGLTLAVISRYKWDDMQRANTVEGLSHIWAMTQSRTWWDLSSKKNGPISLRLKRYICDGKERFMYDAVQPDASEDCQGYVTDHGGLDDEGRC
ncbi:hypothetical protein BWQ96_08525 [Gracilariopsis chorda]|uniref:Uncharacterized protein n=1 Tax=Gracilariopsis chorda TaxID=448386 RepID=A0A2V3II21_9FLOR|nr:hypothetical protein BWQ96_08525 [Gracilariopsis chorda]|eukprot:PXF41736.1 hypothetical protein BWQ96_08525 [Gracilariopsis chorda]